MPETETKEKSSSTIKTTNCASCNKALKRVKWYYRNGKYYCDKKCWRAQISKQKQDSPNV